MRKWIVCALIAAMAVVGIVGGIYAGVNQPDVPEEASAASSVSV